MARGTVLVIDTDRGIADLLRVALEDGGYSVLVLTDPTISRIDGLLNRRRWTACSWVERARALMASSGPGPTGSASGALHLRLSRSLPTYTPCRKRNSAHLRVLRRPPSSPSSRTRSRWRSCWQPSLTPSNTRRHGALLRTRRT
jgi:hypothetical protein